MARSKAGLLIDARLPRITPRLTGAGGQIARYAYPLIPSATITFSL